MQTKFYRFLPIFVSLVIVACNDEKPTATQSPPLKAESTPNITAQIANEPKIGSPNDNPADYEANPQTIEKPAEIAKLVSSIPHLQQALAQQNMKVESVVYGRYTKDEIIISNNHYHKEDISYTFNTSEPIYNQACELTPMFNIDKRGKKWIPQDRTSAYLMHGKCEAPEW